VHGRKDFNVGGFGIMVFLGVVRVPQWDSGRWNVGDGVRLGLDKE
jgi:hypothetical protein